MLLGDNSGRSARGSRLGRGNLIGLVVILGIRLSLNENSLLATALLHRRRGSGRILSVGLISLGGAANRLDLGLELVVGSVCGSLGLVTGHAEELVHVNLE